jgi:error-prone DNA polymerase
MEYAELAAATNFSFLRGAAHPHEMVETAVALGMTGLGIADRNSVAGVVRAWSALKSLRAEGLAQDFKLISGARLVFADGTPDVIAYPITRTGWGNLTQLLSIGNLRAAKGECELRLDDLLDWCAELALIILPTFVDVVVAQAPKSGVVVRIDGTDLTHPTAQRTGVELHAALATLRDKAPHLWIGATMHRAGRDARALAAFKALSAQTRIPLVALNDALYATPEQRPLHDVLTCIREGCTIQNAGKRLEANAERHLKPPAEMARLFADAPEAITATQDILAAIDFDLKQVAYEYPHEPVPPGYTPQEWLETLVTTKARDRWPDGTPPAMQALLDEEFSLIGKMGYAAYFLTVHDIVQFAQGRGILCQGRGSAANSAVCYLLGITAVDPSKYNLLFSRFISEEREEPPDIDVDFEHERREEVMQYVYARYGRDRAGIVATVIHYRPRSAVREVGKALGLSDDITSRLASTVWGHYARKVEPKRYADAGFDLETPEIARLDALVQQILRFPRHLSQHVGGFVLSEEPLDRIVPISNAAMADRTFIEWDKDDIDALGLMKVDVLALGMLTCIRKAFDLLDETGGPHYTLASVPDDAPDVYDMLCAGDSVGVFQVESRAQMNMLPRLRPREFYDLAIQVAIVRPGPIQGDMVHPYLRRRQGREPVEFPSPAPEHGLPDELRGVLGKTLGVPLFQEQAMRLAMVAAKFTGSESNQLRRAMATFRNVGTINQFREKMVGGMVARGYEAEFAERCFKQIEGFGSYGFPESHAIAFARLVWVSSYLKCRYPAAFAAALLNSQPMGFYAPAQIVRDAQEHGVEVRGVDVNHSDWDHTLEDGALRLGFRQIDSLREDWADAIRAARPFSSVEQLARDALLPQRALRLLADADALRSIALDRRQALWEVRRTPADELPLFAAARARELAQEPEVNLPEMALGEHVAADYQTLRLSLKAHPMALLRPIFAADRIKTALDVAQARNGTRLTMAGVVLVRQRPGKGNAVFITLEDETGIVNVVLWARLFELYRREVMAARLLSVTGEVQRSPEGVIHLMANRVENRTAALAHLSETDNPNLTPSRADEFLHPIYPRTPEHQHQAAAYNGEPDSYPAQAYPRIGHPRDVRVLPKSRDFH